MARNWYPRYTGDYARKTSHLSMMEHGAYALLLDHYFSTGKPLPASPTQLHRICRAVVAEEQAAAISVVEQFFILREDGWHNERADEELLKSNDISDKRRKAQGAKAAKHPASEPANDAAHEHAFANTPTTTTTKPLSNKHLDSNPRDEGGVFLTGKGGKGFNVEYKLSETGIQAARRQAPGWDVYGLMRVYSEGVNSGQRAPPENPDRAFPAWCAKYTKGKSP